jgi:hypothetical protein
MVQRLYCVTPNSDAGKSCRDHSECEGSCEATEGTPEGAAAQGRCSKDDYPCGCEQVISNGIAGAEACFD